MGWEATSYGQCICVIGNLEGKDWSRKICEEITADKFSKFDETYKSTDPRSSMSPRQKKHEADYPQIYDQIAYNQWYGEKNIKKHAKKDIHTEERQYDRIMTDFLWETIHTRGHRTTNWKYWKKKKTKLYT